MVKKRIVSAMTPASVKMLRWLSELLTSTFFAGASSLLAVAGMMTPSLVVHWTSTLMPWVVIWDQLAWSWVIVSVSYTHLTLPTILRV